MNAECHEMTLMVKLLIFSVTQHTSQTRVIHTIMHVTLNTVNNVASKHILSPAWAPWEFKGELEAKGH